MKQIYLEGVSEDSVGDGETQSEMIKDRLVLKKDKKGVRDLDI